LTAADEIVEAQARHIAERFATSTAQASAVLLVAYSAAVSREAPKAEVRFWMGLFDASARLLRTERRRLRLPPGDVLLRDLRPLAHLLDLGRLQRHRAEERLHVLERDAHLEAEARPPAHDAELLVPLTLGDVEPAHDPPETGE